MAEANIKASLSIESVEALKKIVEIKQKLKETGELLKAAESGGNFDSKEAEKYGLEIEKLNIALKDANEEFGNVSEKISRFESFKNVLSGVQSGFGAISGTLSLFGEKSEFVEESLEKVKTALEISEGISNIGKAAQAFKLLGVAISETGIGLILIGLVAVVELIKKWNEETKGLTDSEREAAAAQKLLNDTIKEAQSEYVKAVVSINDIKQHIELARQGFFSKKKVLEEYNETMGQTTGVVKAYSDVEAKMSNPDVVKDYVESMEKRALANIALQKSAQNSFDAEQARIAQSKYVMLNEGYVDKMKRGMFVNNAEIQAHKEFEIQQEIINKAEAANNVLFQIRDNAENDALNIIKKYNVKTVEETDHTQTQITENKAKSLTVQLNEQINNYNEQYTLAIQNANNLRQSEENIYNINKQFQEQKISLLQQYYNQAKAIHSKEGDEIAKQIYTQLQNAIAGYDELNQNFTEQQLENTLAEVTQIIKNFKPPAEIAPPPPKSPEEIQKEKDDAEANSNDDKAGKKIQERQDAFNKANPQDVNKSPYQKQLQDLESFYKTTSDMVKKDGANKLKLEQYYSEAKKKLKKQEVDYELRLTANLLSQASDLFGKNTLAGKVTAVAAATINTYLAATKALATTPPPFSYIQAAITIATGIKNIQSIINTQVPGQNGGTGSAPSTPSSPVVPQIQQTNTTLNQDQLNQIGNATVRAFVVESDVSNNQEKIARLNRAARLGG